MRKAWNKIEMDAEEIIRMYLVENKTLRGIASLKGVDRDVIKRVLKENNIKIRTLSETKLLNPQRYWLGKKREYKSRPKRHGYTPWNKGKKYPQITGERNKNWKGGCTPKHQKIRQSAEYKRWRMAVLQRDRFSCVECKYRSKQSYAHGDGKCDIRVDHIKPFSLYPELRFEISNGRTLCVECDKKLGYNFHRDKLVRCNEEKRVNSENIQNG